jgi:hypothetical protein
MTNNMQEKPKKSRSTALCNRRRAKGLVMYQTQVWVKPATYERLKFRVSAVIAEEIALQNSQE